MYVKIKLFASAKDRLQKDAVEISVPRNCTLKELYDCVSRDYPQFRTMVGRWAVNLELKTLDYMLRGDEEIAWIPPVTGG